ncbi:Carcinine transporter, partial [Eumeta japonica]
ADDVTDECIDLDDLLPKIGEFGRYQKLLLWLVCLPSCLPCGFGAFNQLFMSDSPDHWCYVPQLHNLTSEERKKLSIPIKIASNVEHPERSATLLYLVNSTRWLCEEFLCMLYCVYYGECSEKPFNSCRSVRRKYYQRHRDGWHSTIVCFMRNFLPRRVGLWNNHLELPSAFDLVCDYDVYPTLGLMALNIGGPIGVYTFGILNDRIGRKKSFFACLTTLLTGSLMTAYAHKYWLWALARAIVGLTIPAIYQIPFIISLELVGPNYRSFVTVMTCMFYTTGLILLSGITYLLRDWRTLALATSVPFILYYGYWFVMPESPRWLLMKEKLVEANVILKMIARVNGEEFPEEYTLRLQQQLLQQKNNGAKDPKPASVFALCRTPNLRLKTCLITLNWCASEMVYVGLSYYGPSLGKNQYMSFFLSSVVEIPSYIVCWILIDYGSNNLVLPLMVMGAVSVVGGVRALRLPETLHCPLPQTVEEGERFGSDWTYSDCCTCAPKRQTTVSDTYEDLEQLEMNEPPPTVGEETGLPQNFVTRRASMRRLVRQTSLMETQRNHDGTINMTYWF